MWPGNRASPPGGPSAVAISSRPATMGKNPSPIQPVGAMPYYTELYYGLSPLVILVQVAMTVWMLVDASRRGVEFYWFWIIIGAQPFGPWAYFFVYKIKEFQGGAAGFRDTSGNAHTGGWLAGLFHRRPSM